MKVLILLSLVTLALTARLKEKRAPTFTLIGNDRSVDGLPIISVKFPNGVSDTLVLRKFDAGINLPASESKECNYIGHLASEPDACLALTGCPGLDDHVELTILSEHFPGLFKWYKDGHVENLKTPHDLVRQGRPRGMANDMLAEDSFTEARALKPIPTTNNLSVRFGYGDHFREKVGGTNAKAEAYYKKTAAHIQTYFCHKSLGTKIKFTTLSMTHYKGMKLTAAETMDVKMVNTTIKDLKGADLMVYYAFDKTGANSKGPAGVAHLGSACDTRKYGTVPYEAGVNGYKHSITERAESIVLTAWIAAHEIGHNLGMYHAFDAKHGGLTGKCNKHRGVMSYSDNPNYKNPWSTCSKNDFQAHYNAILNLKMPWCLEAVSSNFCSSSGTGTTTTKATTASTTKATTKATTTKATTKATTTKATTKAPSTTGGPGGSGEGGDGDYDYYD
jgi:hypothetical protein